MKILFILLAVAVIFAVIVTGGLLLFLAVINEERKETCGKCDYCDTTLNHCWMRDISVGTEDKACLTFNKRENEK